MHQHADAGAWANCTLPEKRNSARIAPDRWDRWWRGNRGSIARLELRTDFGIDVRAKHDAGSDNDPWNCRTHTWNRCAHSGHNESESRRHDASAGHHSGNDAEQPEFSRFPDESNSGNNANNANHSGNHQSGNDARNNSSGDQSEFDHAGNNQSEQHASEHYAPNNRT